MKLSIILASTIIAVGVSRWLASRNERKTYRTPNAIYAEVVPYAQDLLFGRYRN